MKRIFLSFTPEEKKRANELRRILLAQGCRPWVDRNPVEEHGWHPEIDAALQNADALIVLLTEEAANTIHITYECAFALGRGIPVLAIITEDSTPHPRLLRVTRCDMRQFPDENRFWDDFLAKLRAHLHAATPPRTSPRTLPRNIDRTIMPESPGSWIVARRGPIPNAMFRLERDIVTLGRDESNSIVISDTKVSRYHLRLSHSQSGYNIEDLNSSNGTRVNGRKIAAKTALKHGDLITLSDSVMLSYEIIPK